MNRSRIGDQGLLAHPGGAYLICVFVPLVFAGLWFLRLFLSATVPPPAA
jgi:hypothetical protein